MNRGHPILAVHGGAGVLALESAARALAEGELRVALTLGWAVLAAGGRALDAVAEAVRSMERSGCFNAGRGAEPDASGAITLDAAIMDGETRAAGAVAAVTQVASAITAARRVMERTPHVLLVGPPADAFALAAGVAPAPADYFRKRDPAASSHSTPGTVGAVALDAAGHLAAATSTGGLAGKLPGRVGDSAVIGAGTWADAECAVSATGRGEFFIRTAFAHQVAMGVSQLGWSLAEATRRALTDVVFLAQSEAAAGGCVAVSRDGTIAMPFSTAGMFRGKISESGEPWVASLFEPGTEL